MSTVNEAPLHEGPRYDSFSALKEVHAMLLKRYSDGENAEVLDDLETFIHRAAATGAVLDVETEREASQSLLDYWMTVIYRAKRTPPDATLADFNPDLSPRLDDSQCPYRGLNAFQESDKELFFGRHRVIELLLKKLKTNRILFVDGPSGSGKSSVVLAGLIPALKADILPGSGSWRYLRSIVPGGNPLNSLARSLAALDDRPAQWIAEQAEGMARNPEHLLSLVSSFGPEAVVLVVDQFEEVFTLCLDDALRDAFINNLLALANSANPRHQIILTLRTDYNTYLAQYPALMKRFETGQVRVLPLTASDLRAAIEEPARRINLKFEEGVVDALVRDILGEPEGLPLLQFTLLRLWKTREDNRNRITLAQYRKLGGARRALALTADEFYHSLTEAKRFTLERIMLRLALPSGNAEVLRNTVRRETLYFEAPHRVDEVLDALSGAGLVRITKGETPANDKVEIAHEALVRHWPMLVEWIEKRRVSMRQRLRLTVAAEQWLAHGKDEGGLLGGSLLTEALQQEDLNDLEKQFVQASEELAQRFEQEKEAAREREDQLNKQTMLALQQRADAVAKSEKRLRIFVTILAALTIFSLGAGGFGWWQATQARTSETSAKRNEKVAEARRLEAEGAGLRAEAARLEAERQEKIALKKESERAEAAKGAITAQKLAEAESANAKRQTAIAVAEKKKADKYLKEVTLLKDKQTAELDLKNKRESADADLKKKRYQEAIGNYRNLIPEYMTANDLRGAGDTLSKLSIAYRDLADKLKRKGDSDGGKLNSDKAEQAYAEALEIFTRQKAKAGNDNAKLTSALWELAQFYLDQGKLKEVDATYRVLLDNHESALSKSDLVRQRNYDDFVDTMVDFLRDNPDALEQLYVRVLNKKKAVYDIESDEVYLSLKDLARFYRDHDKYEKLIPVYVEVVDLLKKLEEKHPDLKTDETYVELVVDGLTNIADAYGKLKRPDYAASEKYYSSALAIAKSALPPNAQESQHVYDIQIKLAEVLSREKKYSEALTYYDQAVKFYSRDRNTNIERLAMVLAAEGQIYLAAAQDNAINAVEAEKNAMAVFKDAVAAISGSSDTEPKDRVADVLVQQVIADHASGAQSRPEQAGKYFARAEELSRLALSISPQTQPKTYESLRSSLRTVGERGFKSGDVSGVASLYEQVLDFRTRGTYRNDSGVDYLVQELEKMYRDGRQNEKLIALYKRALDIREKSEGGIDSPTVYTTYNNLGQLYMDMGKYKEAAEAYQKALVIVERVFQKDDPSYVVDSLSRLANAYRWQTEYAEAEKLYQRAKSNLEKHSRAETTKMADILDGYAEILEILKRLPEAAKLRENSQRIRSKGGVKARK